MATYDLRRDELTAYFDRTAAAAWEALTSDAPVSRIRATVRAGRTRMRQVLLAQLPADLTGTTLLDAGCGTGALAVEAAAKGAAVIAVDVSPRLVGTARDRFAGKLRGTIDWRVGDMLAADLGRFDHVVAMDSLIHYETRDIAAALATLAARTERSIVFTVAPKTPMLTLMHMAGRLFPRGDRAPAIVPVATPRLARAVAAEPALAGWTLRAVERVDSSFYMSQAMVLARA